MSDPAPEVAPVEVAIHTEERVPTGSIRPHPQNYRRHPQDQRDHLRAALTEVGQHKAIVVARDGTILAGHGLYETMVELGMPEVKIVRLPIDPDSVVALKVLAGDNESQRLAETDDRALSGLLASIKDDPLGGLLGTGFDEAMLANLVFVTRPASEIRTLDEAAQWAGLPGFPTDSEPDLTLVLHFDTEEDRAKLIEQLQIVISKKMRQTWSAWWPPREKQDLASLRFDDPAETPAAADG